MTVQQKQKLESSEGILLGAANEILLKMNTEITIENIREAVGEAIIGKPLHGRSELRAKLVRIIAEQEGINMDKVLKAEWGPNHMAVA